MVLAPLHLKVRKDTMTTKKLRPDLVIEKPAPISPERIEALEDGLLSLKQRTYEDITDLTVQSLGIDGLWLLLKPYWKAGGIDPTIPESIMTPAEGLLAMTLRHLEEA